MTEEEAIMQLEEEYTDVRTCATELNLYYDKLIEAKKRRRFEERWAKKKEADDDN